MFINSYLTSLNYISYGKRCIDISFCNEINKNTFNKMISGQSLIDNEVRFSNYDS